MADPITEHGRDMLIVRGFGRTTDALLAAGYAAGPSWLIHEMSKFQQYSFVCTRAWLSMRSWRLGMWTCRESSPTTKPNEQVLDILSPLMDITVPEGAFYAFLQVPYSLGMSGTQFTERLLDHNVIAIPGAVFSERDTHFESATRPTTSVSKWGFGQSPRRSRPADPIESKKKIPVETRGFDGEEGRKSE